MGKKTKTDKRYINQIRDYDNNKPIKKLDNTIKVPPKMIFYGFIFGVICIIFNFLFSDSFSIGVLIMIVLGTLWGTLWGMICYKQALKKGANGLFAYLIGFFFNIIGWMVYSIYFGVNPIYRTVS